MKKGSRSRKCRCCGKIIGWVIPKKEGLFGFRECEMKTLPDFAMDNKGYICKQCKAVDNTEYNGERR